MSLFSKSKEKEELVLVFDIGSSSVGGALFFAKKVNAPKIIYSIREPIDLKQEIDFPEFMSLMNKALDTVVNKISLAGLGAPKKIYCVLSSPWYSSQIRNISYQKDTPFVFSSKLADSLLQKEITSFEEEHLKQYLENNNKIEPIELRNMCTTLNGYVTSKPINQKTKDAEMVIFISMSPADVLEKIKQSIGKHFHTKDIKFSSFAMTSFSVSRSMFVNQENFLLVDVGGELTEISMVKKDILRSSASFPLGSNFLIRGMSSELKCSLDEAKSYLSIFKDGHAEKDTHEKIEAVIKKLKATWLLKFQESLVNISHDISIPSTIFLTTDKDLSEFWTETIKAEQYNQYTLTESKFNVVFLGVNALHGVVNFQENTNRDPLLIIEAIYINHFLF